MFKHEWRMKKAKLEYKLGKFCLFHEKLCNGAICIACVAVVCLVIKYVFL